MAAAAPTPAAAPPKRSLLDWIEWLGNKRPEPVLLFAILATVVRVLSVVGDALGWSVQPVKPMVTRVEKLDAAGAPVLDAAGAPVRVPALGPDGRPEVALVESGAPIAPRSLLTGGGVVWALSSMLRNFTGMPVGVGGPLHWVPPH